MTRKRPFFLLLLLVTAAGAAVCRDYSIAAGQQSGNVAADDARRRGAVPNERLQQSIAVTDIEPSPDDAMDRAVPKGYPRPVSMWRSNEKAIYRRMLSKGRFDWLVVPFQVQRWGLDRATRSLMTAQLALAIGAAKNARVPDPYLVARALGDGERRLDFQEVYKLANMLGVKHIVWGYVGYNADLTMRLTIQYREFFQSGDVQRVTPLKVRHFENVAFSDDNPPIEVFQTLLPEALKMIGVDPRQLSAREPAKPSGFGALPLGPLAMVAAKPDAARDALYLQLFAVLAPRYGDRTKERLIEKSLLAVYSLSPRTPGYRILKARAFMYLGLRRAALQALGTAQTPEEEHLRAVLNGNLPDAQRLAEEIKSGTMRLIASAEVNEIAAAYGVRNQTESIQAAESLQEPGDIWPFLAVRAFTDWDLWSQHENANLKTLLDREFPLPDFSLESIMRGIASLGDMAHVQDVANLSVLNHVRRLLDNNATTWCCAALAARPTALDYLDLLESLGTDNLMRRAKFLTAMQGSPESALEFLSRIESVYKDHPQHALARAEAEFRMAQRAGASGREARMRSAYTNAFNALYWEQSQTPTSANAFNLYLQLGRTDYGYADNLFAYDYPFRSYYSAWAAGGSMEIGLANARAAIAASTHEFQPVANLNDLLGNILKQWDKVDELMKSIEGRFLGHPQRAVLMARNSLRNGDRQAAARHFRSGIQAQPGYWPPYMDLGILLLEDGNIAEAAGMFMDYPGFKGRSTENRVGLSNHAYDAGSLFYWTGNFMQAVPLYRIAAELHTGSDASLASEIRLRLIDRDIAGAAVASLNRARRYNSSFAYRDYLGMLHAMGQSRPAWDAFNVLVAQMDEPQIWETVLVGHRLEGLTEAQIAAWAGQERLRRSGRDLSHAAMYFLRAGVTDRMPSGEFVASLAAMDRPVWKLGGENNHVVRPRAAGGNAVLLGPVSAPGVTLPRGLVDTVEKNRVKSELVYFAEGYRAIRAGNFQSARALLQEGAELYDLSLESVGYLLPYYAYASAKGGDTAAVGQLLDRIPPDRRRFDYYLARAVIAGIAGDAESSLKSLTSAIYRRPFTESRPLYTEYQFAELCEWLYDSTGNTKYRDLALDWAKKNQTFQPWYAWPYAMEAKLSTDARARGRAIAMTYYLDQNSERLSALPKHEVEAAVKKFRQDNPFLRAVGSEPSGAT
jgi:hypothetical protein